MQGIFLFMQNISDRLIGDLLVHLVHLVHLVEMVQMDYPVLMVTPDVEVPMEIEGSLGCVAPRGEKDQRAAQEPEDQ